MLRLVSLSIEEYVNLFDKKVIINNTIKIDKMIGLEKGILSKKSIIF